MEPPQNSRPPTRDIRPTWEEKGLFLNINITSSILYTFYTSTYLQYLPRDLSRIHHCTTHNAFNRVRWFLRGVLFGGVFLGGVLHLTVHSQGLFLLGGLFYRITCGWKRSGGGSWSRERRRRRLMQACILTAEQRPSGDGLHHCQASSATRELS